METWNSRDRSRTRVGQPVRRMNLTLTGNKLTFAMWLLAAMTLPAHINSPYSRWSSCTINYYPATVDLAHAPKGRQMKEGLTF